jgi:diacylglycerol kinase (CTP)
VFRSTKSPELRWRSKGRFFISLVRYSLSHPVSPNSLGTGLGVPLLYQVLISSYGWTQSDYSKFCWFITSGIWLGDLIRISVPASNAFFPFTLLNKIMRDHERHQLSGTCYFSLGCTIAITLFPPAVATTSIIWLVLGDMSAALIGVSCGGDIVVVKMGRGGKKSMEGSAAMFVVCVVVGMVAFSGRYLNEYPVFLGALTATIVELYEPFQINDNLSIPVISSLALQWGLSRIDRC